MKNILKLENYELLNQKVYNILKNAIVRGDLKPNSRLMLSEIPKSLGISKTPIREAINKLASEGFVKMIPNRGIIVKKIDISNVQEILEIREELF